MDDDSMCGPRQSSAADAVAAPLLHCCGHELTVGPDAAVCARCTTHLTVDDLGIVQLADVAPNGGEFEEFVAASSLRPIMEAILRGDAAWTAERQQQLLDWSTGVAAVLAGTPSGTFALDLATGWTRLAEAIQSSDAHAVCADHDYGRLRLTTMALGERPATSVLLDPAEALPWGDSSFSTVFVRPAATPADLDHILAEVARVLTADGVAVIGSRRALDERDVRGSLRRIRRWWRPAWHLPGFRRAGLRADRIYVIVPGSVGWAHVMPREHYAAWLLDRPRDSRRNRIAAWLARFGLSPFLARECLIVASKATSESTTPRPGLDPVVGGRFVASSMTAARVGVRGLDAFAKVPLSRTLHDATRVEVQRTNQARAGAFGRFVVGSARVGQLGPIPYAMFPLVRGRTPMLASNESYRDVEELLVRILAAVEPEVRPLHATDLWRALTDPPPYEPSEVGRLRDALIPRCRDALVPAGPIHGDLHPWNLLLPELGGQPVVVDWAGYEENYPVAVDAIRSCVALYTARTASDMRAGLEAFASGSVRGPLAEYASSHLGELSPLSASALTLITHEHWDAPLNPSIIRPYLDAVSAMASRLDEAERP